ncbi:MAG TPA: hypothetical protein VKP61_15590 [Candidatus Acidoferrum sp.]|nr:hypothetical protein [Candidatus Acidoferrum sp.]
MHFILRGRVIDRNFFACSNVFESPHAQAAEIQECIRIAAMVQVTNGLFPAECMLSFTDLQRPSGRRRQDFFPVQVDQNLVPGDRFNSEKALSPMGQENI